MHNTSRRKTNQQYSPSGGQECQEAYKYVFYSHVKQYYQHNQNSEERNEYHELDQTEEQLKVRAEPPPSDRYDLKRR